jgi:N-acetylmuramic acid 6-phosphate etherase
MHTTEQPSNLDGLNTLPVATLLAAMNQEDTAVPVAVQGALPQLEAFVTALVHRMQQGGRLFYTGAGTSGRLGVVDASECPPTFGVPPGVVVGLIAGGDTAIRQAVEGAEDDAEQGWQDVLNHRPTPLDTVVGISASGSAPYVLGAVRQARRAGLLTGCITCNTGSVLAQAVECAIEVVVGPEFITGSTRLKAGTAQKLVLNMISTVAMIRLGRVHGNRMVDMQLTNAKLVERGTRYVMDATGLPFDEAQALLLEHGSVRRAVGSQPSAIRGQQ